MHPPPLSATLPLNDLPRPDGWEPALGRAKARSSRPQQKAVMPVQRSASAGAGGPAPGEGTGARRRGGGDSLLGSRLCSTRVSVPLGTGAAGDLLGRSGSDRWRRPSQPQRRRNRTARSRFSIRGPWATGCIPSPETSRESPRARLVRELYLWCSPAALSARSRDLENLNREFASKLRSLRLPPPQVASTPSTGPVSPGPVLPSGSSAPGSHRRHERDDAHGVRLLVGYEDLVLRRIVRALPGARPHRDRCHDLIRAVRDHAHVV